jgi:CheY-like chemotaxis protein
MGYTQLLVSGAIPAADVAHAYQAIQRNAQAQARLVESLLDLSRILAGKLELNSEVQDVSSIVALAVDAVRPEALKKQITVAVCDAPGLHVFGDAVRLQQVFWNLLTNAVKFTPAGGRVVVQVATDGADVNVHVEDNGRGIPASFLPFVFDRFKQGDGPGRSQTGLGLGLALVREMVHAHKGTVTAHSAGEGAGSTFTVRLPLLLSREKVESDRRRSISESKLEFRQSQPDVLIVDDERDAREMLALMLETRGARVRQVGSAAEAFELMLQRRPAILLADLGMSEEDGYSLIRRWRTQEASAGRPRVAAIAVTAYASPRDRDVALAAGFDWHMAKPVDADELVRVITALQAQPPG